MWGRLLSAPNAGLLLAYEVDGRPRVDRIAGQVAPNEYVTGDEEGSAFPCRSEGAVLHPDDEVSRWREGSRRPSHYWSWEPTPSRPCRCVRRSGRPAPAGWER